MKRLAYALLAWALASAPAWTQDARPSGVGVGLELGDPTGITGQYFLSRTQAIAAAVDFDDFQVHADYQWYGWNALPKPAQGSLPVYVGLGVSAASDNFGLRGSGGIGYWFAKVPVQVYFELAPTIWLAHDRGYDTDIALGVRYYFRSFN